VVSHREMNESSKGRGRTFVCQECGHTFTVSESVLGRFPGWTPRSCLACRNKTGAEGARAPAARGGTGRSAAASREEDLPVSAVLARYTSGPKDGVFTDGAASPNPGPGGWGAVYVIGDHVVAEEHGHEPHTTNNRMELLALIAGCRLVPPGTPAVLHTDSELCVNTMTKWAKGWEARGWKRKDGPIKNLELVKQLYATLRARPELELRWIAAHSGHRWNEYADALATAYRRQVR
jgi:ribonuclease HI